MPRNYSPDFWELDSLLDSSLYAQLSKCVTFVEDQIGQFDERNETEFEDEFGTLIQAAFIMTVVARMENHLKRICNVIGEARNLRVRFTDLRGANGFESCIAYLKKVLQIDLPSDLNTVRGIVEIRNKWVHEDGNLPQLPRALGELRNNVKISSNGRIEFTGPFVQEACKVCRAFMLKIEEATQNETRGWVSQKKKRASRVRG